ncbi:uncharacterized protein BT62DRAFT_890834 [Guyanagaster necrorhizus]|uniref:Uncharacterized protein n=1 Tax=Guyanagaster necrorhizus TaxID=856835 RepID=A0A9P7VVX8_9AGAR|nr:uncharacterized protein BT62DRAFT_890834 [Guyanagaster necrorhizus MCA 3950]KAG7448333.1 hypothetical protein BT62DRAFT_890834 [Guyanagaster necrorhizus MCA 3950]
MFPTLARFSKASRRPLTSKRAGKDFYKGTRQSALPGGPRTGAPGKHVIRGKAKYRLLDEKVRIFIAPPIEAIESSPLKAYVERGVHLTKKEERAAFGKFTTNGGLTPEHFLKVMRKAAGQRQGQGKNKMPSNELSVADALAVPTAVDTSSGKKRRQLSVL